MANFNTSQTVKHTLIAALKKERQFLDRKMRRTLKMDKLSTLVEAEKKGEDWQEFRVM